MLYKSTKEREIGEVWGAICTESVQKMHKEIRLFRRVANFVMIIDQDKEGNLKLLVRKRHLQRMVSE